jgi:hypothetical protein
MLLGRVLTGVMLLVSVWPVAAQVRLDQSNESPLTGTVTTAMRGDLVPFYTQVVKAGVSGRIAGIRLPMKCEPNANINFHILQVSEEGIPDRTHHWLGLASLRLDADGLLPEFVPVSAPTSLAPASRWIEAGTRFAIESYGFDPCYWATTPEDSYPDGAAYAAGRDPLPFNLGFATFMDVGSAYCEVAGFRHLDERWLPRELPVCRCLQDAVGIATRCSFRVEGYEIIREMPRYPKDQFEINWLVIPLEDSAPKLVVRHHSASGAIDDAGVHFASNPKPMHPTKVTSTAGAKPGVTAELDLIVDVGELSYRFRTIDREAK